MLHDNLAVYINVDGMLYEDEVRALASGDDTFLSPVASPRLVMQDVKNCDAADSDDEFTMVVCADPVMPSNILPQSPQLSTATVSPEILFLESSPNHGELEQLPPPLVCEHGATQVPGLQANATASSSGTSAIVGHAQWHRAVLLLFPLQLGCEKHISKHYTSAVPRYLELQTSLGAMGGRPRMAHFLVGHQGSNLLYVDPHVVQPAALPAAPGEVGECTNGTFPGAESFRNLPSVSAIPIEHIDSSISLAFYCCCDSDLTALIADLKEIEKVERDAPVRSELVRPPELRPFLDAESFPTGTLLALAADSPQSGPASSQSSFDLADEAVHDTGGGESDAGHSEVEEELSSVQIVEMVASEEPMVEAGRSLVGGQKPKMSVGAAWSSIETSL